jgi:hypothetical protein
VHIQFQISDADRKLECRIRGRPKSADTCTRESHKYCGSKGTSAFNTCRAIYQRFCVAPRSEISVDSCLRDRCDSLPGDQWHKAPEVRQACRTGDAGSGGMTHLCKQQVCEPEAPRNCDIVPGRSHAECTTKALMHCGPKTTSSFTTCRTLYTKFCVTPRAEISVESCLKSRCDSLESDQWHSAADKARACRDGDGHGGMAQLCLLQVCKRTTPPQVVVEKKRLCALPAGKSAPQCVALANRYCGTKGTSAFTTCRTLFQKFCITPRAEESIERCMRDRCDSLPGDQWHKAPEVRDACRNGDAGSGGMSFLCKEQVCRPINPTSCDLPRPRDDKECAALALKHCGPKATSSFTTCRTLYAQFCMAPRAETSLESCLKSRCDTLEKDQWHSAAEKSAACRLGDGNGGLTQQCAHQVCVPRSCALLEGKSAAVCTQQSQQYCGTKATSAFTACREIYIKFCLRPAGVRSVESCLRARCDGIAGDQWHNAAAKSAACRLAEGLGGLSHLCSEQVCKEEPLSCHGKCQAKARVACGTQESQQECRTKYETTCIKDFGCVAITEPPTPIKTCDELCTSRAMKMCGKGDNKVTCRAQYHDACQVNEKDKKFLFKQEILLLN